MSLPLMPASFPPWRSLPLMLGLIARHGLTEQHLQHVCYCDMPHLHGNDLLGSSGKLLKCLLEF